MTRSVLIFAAGLLLALPAVAQGDAEFDEPTGDFNPPPRTPLPVSRTTETTTTTTSTVPVAAASTRSKNHRPREPWSLGIGAGWNIPADLFVPNTASVRFMFPGSVTLEPFANFSVANQSNLNLVEQPLVDPVENDTANTSLQLTGGATVRIPIITRGNLNLQLLTTASVSQSANFPDLGDDASGGSDSTSASLAWGLGVEWFIFNNIAFTADASNPLAVWTRSHSETITEIEFIDPDSGQIETGEVKVVDDTSSFNVGAIFSPTIRAMVHLYF